jgi:cell wall assembly regulator SMI1
MSGVAASWRTIEGVLWENAHSLYRALRKPATDAQIARLANLVPAKLSRDFVQSLKTHDGLRDSHLGQNRLFDYNALLPVSAIITEYKMLCSLQAECGFPGGQAGGDSGVRNDAHWRPGWVPIMDADGDKLVLDLDPAPGGSVGQVFKWSNTGSSPLRVLAQSFGKWLAGLAEALSKRRFGLDERGGIWLGGVPSAEPNAAPDHDGMEVFWSS